MGQEEERRGTKGLLTLKALALADNSENLRRSTTIFGALRDPAAGDDRARPAILRGPPKRRRRAALRQLPRGGTGLNQLRESIFLGARPDES